MSINSGPNRLPVRVRKVSLIFSMPFIFSLNVRCSDSGGVLLRFDHEPERRREVFRSPPELVGIIERIAYQPSCLVVPIKGLLKRFVVPDGVSNVLALSQAHAERRQDLFRLDASPNGMVLLFPLDVMQQSGDDRCGEERSRSRAMCRPRSCTSIRTIAPASRATASQWQSPWAHSSCDSSR